MLIREKIKSKHEHYFLAVLLGITLLTIPIDRSLSSLSYWVLFGMTLFFGRKTKWQWTTEMTLLALLWIAHLLSVCYIRHLDLFASKLQKNVGLLFFPFLLFHLKNILSKDLLQKTFRGWNFALHLLEIFLLISAIYNYTSSGDSTYLFYHKLAAPIDASAVYLSLIIALAVLVTVFDNELKPFVKSSSLMIHAVFLILLSIRNIMIALPVVLLIYFLISKKRNIKKYVFFGGLAVLTVFCIPQVSHRFKDAVGYHPEHIWATKVTDTTAFNGSTLRARLWKYGYEMQFNSLGNTVVGLGPGETQVLLDEKITLSNMYIGDGSSENKGFLGYNFHNEYVQKLTETGLIGLFLLLFYIGFKIRKSIRYKDQRAFTMLLLFSIAFCTESYLSTQIGIYTFLTFMILIPNNDKIQQHSY